MGLALFSIAFVALSVAASLPVFLPRTNSITATGQAFLLASMAGIFYFIARAVIAHRLLHVGKSLLWLSADRLLIPVCTWALELVFNTGLRKTVDFSRWLDGPVFEPLRNRSEFKFFVAGGTVCWPNGADIAPETLFSVQGVSERAA